MCKTDVMPHLSSEWQQWAQLNVCFSLILTEVLGNTASSFDPHGLKTPSGGGKWDYRSRPPTASWLACTVFEVTELTLYL